MLQAREAHTLTHASRNRLAAVKLAHLLEQAEQAVRAATAQGEFSCSLDEGERFNDHDFVQAMESAGYRLEWPRRSKTLCILWGHANG